MPGIGIQLNNAVKTDYMAEDSNNNTSTSGSIWDTIATNLGPTLQGVASVISASKGNNSSYNGNTYVPAAQTETTGINNTWLWIGGGALLLLVMVFFLFSGKK